MTNPEPVLTKLPPNPKRDHKLMTWERFLRLRAWAQWIAWRQRCTVALVGSVLEKTVPRDIDVALIWPAAEFEAMFGSTKYVAHNQAYRDKYASLYISAQDLVEFDTRIDVRLCPECWWPEKDRLVLATPSETEPPNSWEGVEFVVSEIVR
jgi:hypothetical protein